MAHQDITLIPVILCGGSGARLWPMSREDTPKQFLTLGGNNSLLVDTVDRALKCSHAAAEDIVIVTLDSLKTKTVQDIAPYDANAVSHVLGEPMARNTAAAIAYAALYVKAQFGPDAVMWVLPADHYVGAPARLKDALADAIPLAAAGHIVTFGMPPDRAETEYGYIETGEPRDGSNRVFAMTSFKEKPDSETAATYVADGGYVWNSGMFVFTAGTVLAAYETHAPAITGPIAAAFSRRTNVKTIAREIYESLPKLPFDKAIMEKIGNGTVVVCDIGWSDIGSWESLWHLRDKDPNGNSVSGRAAVMESADCLIQASSLLIAAIGLQDVAIVEHGDTVLVADKKNPEAMRKLVETLSKAGSKEARRGPFEPHSWGTARLLSESPGYKAVEMTIAPGQSLDTHYHLKRCEFWTIVKGRARLTIGDATTEQNPGQQNFIPVGITHTVTNIGQHDLVMIEVQCGIELEEDDYFKGDGDSAGRNAA